MSSLSPRQNIIYGLLLAALVFGLDVTSKLWALDLFQKDPLPKEVCDVFNLRLVFNHGISYGWLNFLPPIALLSFAFVVVMALVWWMRASETRLALISLALIIGGALGNMIDRVRLGAVVDFLDFHWGIYHFPTFNVADCAITIGAILLLLDGLITLKDTSKNAKS